MSWAEWLAFKERRPSLARLFARTYPKRVPADPSIRIPRFDRTKHARIGRAWSEAEDRILVAHWGWSMPRLVKLLGRPPGGIRYRAAELKLGPPIHALEAVSLRRFAETSGFSVTKIRHAAADLGISLSRAPRARAGKALGRTIAITTEKADQLLERMLAGGFIGRSRAWGQNGHPPACVGCGTTHRPHKARDRCGRCYKALRRGADLAEREPEADGRLVGDGLRDDADGRDRAAGH